MLSLDCAQCCVDNNKYCPQWAAHGVCKTNPSYMNSKCRKSCSQCSTGNRVNPQLVKDIAWLRARVVGSQQLLQALSASSILQRLWNALHNAIHQQSHQSQKLIYNLQSEIGALQGQHQQQVLVAFFVQILVITIFFSVYM